MPCKERVRNRENKKVHDRKHLVLPTAALM